MNVRTLKDNAGAVFSPKVSTDSVYLSGSKTNLTTKLSNIDNSISGKADSFTVSSSENTAAWGKSVTVGTVAGTDLKFVMPANPDTDTHYTAKNVVASSSTGTTNVTAATSNPYINLIENGAVRSTHRISGSGATSVNTDTSGNILISSTNTTYSSGTDLSLSGTTFNHANSGVTAGTYRSVTVNARGHVTAGTNPTTLSGYGITDAKIASGVITLGSNTIAPLTADSTLAAGKVSGTLATGNIPNLDASKITSGTISVDRLPATALERCVVVADDTARFKLTTSSVQVGDTVKVTATKKMYMVINSSKLTSEAGYEEYFTSTDWSTITNKPSSYTPSSHTHAKSQITDFPTSMPASDVYPWAKAANKPSYAWSEITDKPSTFTPASHTHNYAGSSSAGGPATSLNYFKNTSTKDIGIDSADSNGIGYVTGTKSILGVNDGALYRQVYSSAWLHEIYGDYVTGQIAVRSKNNGNFTSWRVVLDSTNYKTYCTPANIGASPSSHTHTKDNITDFPTIPTKTSQLTNDSGFITGSYLPISGGTLTGTLNLNQYLKINAWSGYGTGSADFWYDGNRAMLTGGSFGIQCGGFYVSSLRSLKENIEPTKVKATDLINSQEIVDFNYKADEDKVHKIGLIADDSDPLFLDKKGETVDLYNTCGILMKAVQELSKRVEELEQKLK